MFCFIRSLLRFFLFTIIFAIAQAQNNELPSSPFGIHDPLIPHVDNFNDIKEVGADWIRYAGPNGIVWDMIEPQPGVFDWHHHDILYLDTCRHGLKMFVTILTPSQAYDEPLGHAPKNIKAYLNFLRETVERYDGDGFNDAPGSPIVQIWQIENEPDLFWKDSPESYALLLKESYITIKQANPAAKVAIGGVGTPHGFYEKGKFYLKVLKALKNFDSDNQNRFFDIFDFHWYPFTGKFNTLIEHIPHNPTPVYFKEYLNIIRNGLAEYGYSNVPIVITETAQYSGKPALSDYMYSQTPELAMKLTQEKTEQEQAIFLFKTYIYALANGIETIFWVTLTEWHNFGDDTDALFDHVGLINNPINPDKLSHKKLAYYTHKKLSEFIRHTDWRNIQTIREKDGLYIYRIPAGHKFYRIAWYEGNGEKSIQLSTKMPKVKITFMIPNQESGKFIQNIETAFVSEIIIPVDNHISVKIGNIPVIIEE